jgi:hypothetical protein
MATPEVSTSQFRIQFRAAHETVRGTRPAYLVSLLHNARLLTVERNYRHCVKDTVLWYLTRLALCKVTDIKDSI